MKIKKSLLWGAFITPFVLGSYFLFGGYRALATGPSAHFHGGMREHVGFRDNHMMNAPHHGEFFSIGFLIIMIIGVVIAFFLVKLLRKRSKSSSMQHLIDTTFIRSQSPVMNQNEAILDQWEKNLTNIKEKE